MPSNEKIKTTASTERKTVKKDLNVVSNKNRVLTEVVTKEGAKGLSAAQKIAIATTLGVAAATAVAVPVSMHILDINNTPVGIRVAINMGDEKHS